jgi:CRISPR/Cas system CSM-associated protein Csm2 small subunit
MKMHIEKKKEEICKRLDKNVKSNLNGKSLVVNVYNMKIVLAYEDLRDKMNIALANI